jgi:L-fuculose-phosphate aldolase
MHSSVLAVLNVPIPPLFDETVVTVGNLIEVVPYALSGSPELLANVVEKLANRGQCYILQNHGALCVGKNLDKAVAYLELLEKNAAIYCQALATGKPVVTLPQQLAEALAGIAHASQDMEIARKQNS